MLDFTIHSAETAQVSANALNVLKNAVQSDIDSERMYGGVMIVARYGKIVLRETFGTTDDKRATTFDDMYLMMSVSKSFTALLTLQTVERGLFGLDTRIAERLPEFAAHGKENITVFHLLTHQAGMFGMLIMPDLSPSDMGNIDAVFAKCLPILQQAPKPVTAVLWATAYSANCSNTPTPKGDRLHKSPKRNCLLRCR
ncbi:serine hydrolase domain-containing protein [Testudinibacter sp. P27/CKL/0425]